MNGLLLISSLLIVCCAASPRGFNLAHMQQMASGAKSSRSTLPEVVGAEGGDVRTLGELESLHVVGLTTHPTDADKLIYADETALYEFNKESGESRMVAGRESSGLLAHRQPVDGVGKAAEFKYITKIQSRESGVYVFDYDTLRMYTPSDGRVHTVTSLFDANWMERSPITGTVTDAEDRVYFTTTEGFGHFVLSVGLPDGDMTSAELVTAGPSLISSMALTQDERYLMLGDVDTKTLIRVTIGEANSEQFIDMADRPFYPGAMSALSNNEVLVINSMAHTLNTFDVDGLKESDEVICDEGCPSNPLDVAVDHREQVIYVLDVTNHSELPTYTSTIKVIGKAQTAEEGRVTDGREQLTEYIAYMQRMLKLYEKSAYNHQ